MSTAKKLASPIRLFIRDQTPLPEKTPEPTFLKFGSPYHQPDRFFIGLDPAWNRISAIEFTEGSHIAYVESKQLKDKNFQVYDIKPTYHPNIVNLKEVFIDQTHAFFFYESWGISLDHILGLSPRFSLGEVEVATICKGVLHGLQYIHEELGTRHGNLDFSTIIINQDGQVKLADIGGTMIRGSNHDGKQRDLKALCQIARGLLSLDKATTIRGTIGLLADSFTDLPQSGTAKDLLQHPFLKISTGNWCLRPLHTFCAFSRQ